MGDKFIKLSDLKVTGLELEKFKKQVEESMSVVYKKKPNKSTKKASKKTESNPSEPKKAVKKTESNPSEPKKASKKTESNPAETKKASKKTESNPAETKKAVNSKDTGAKINKSTKKTAVNKNKDNKLAVDVKCESKKSTTKNKTKTDKIDVVEIKEKSTAERVSEEISRKKSIKALAEKSDKPSSEKTKKVETKNKQAKKEDRLVLSGMDLLVSFDTTGSMYPVLAQVRREVVKLVTDINNTVKDLRIGIIAHGDYCDANNPYTIKIMDFTDDINSITSFINNVESTSGGDPDECYELVINQARTTVNWGLHRNKVFVLIGDANPHGLDYRWNTKKLDWKNEASLLGDMGVRVFAVHALSYYRNSSKGFYTKLASITNGTYLTLDQFSEVTDLIRATCYSQYSEEQLDKFVTIIRNNGKLSNSLARNINRLYGREVIEGIPEEYNHKTTRSYGSGRYATDETLVQEDGLIPIAPGRFQTMEVEDDCAIKTFVEDNGIHFIKGHAFYELTKAETVQQYKEVILQDRKTGEMFNGAQVREYLGLKPQIAAGGVHEKLYSKDAKDFRIFVQSTSVNRKLIGGTVMLYEIADE